MRSVVLAAATAAAGCRRGEFAAAPAEPAPAAACRGRVGACGARMRMHGSGMGSGAMHGTHHRTMRDAHADSAAAPVRAASRPAVATAASHAGVRSVATRIERGIGTVMGSSSHERGSPGRTGPDVRTPMPS